MEILGLDQLFNQLIYSAMILVIFLISNYLKKCPQFPVSSDFNEYFEFNLQDRKKLSRHKLINKTVKYWIMLLKILINTDKEVKFFKTHNLHINCKVGEYAFTNLGKHTLATLFICS